MGYKNSILISLVAALIAGCYLAKKAPPVEIFSISPIFDHTRHVATYAYADCVKCHTIEGATAPDFKTYRKQICHDCHVDQKYPTRAVSVCGKCHSNEYIQNAIDIDHRLNGIFSHKNQRRLKGYACSDCHESRWCEDCHLNRNTIVRSAHPANYISLHSIEAAANPAHCGSCHIEASCEACHKTSRWP